ncbi:MAG: hypothetical protein GC180_08665 [Bacteroidetes bacterium]|nr:hypothetical protein [Bacteroidota bacterium]
MHRILLTLLILFNGWVLQAQNHLLHYSWRLSALGYDMVECRKDKERDSCLALFNANMDSVLQLPGSFAHSFDSVKNIMIVNAPDKSFRIITWGFRHPNDSFSFYGVLQYADETKEYVWLSDSSASLKNQPATYYAELGPDNWYGAIYYQIRQVKYKKEHYYLLLGWNGTNNQTDQKVLDVLSWNDQGEIVFGLPLFNLENKLAYQNRVIWEYKNGANMALKVTSKNLIIFEHIVPQDPRAIGVYTLYLPDGTYDFFKFKRGIWYKKEMLYDHYKNPGY